MTAVDDLVPWLRGQIAEDRRLATEAMNDRSGVWAHVLTPGGDNKVVDDLGYSVSGHYDIDSEPWWTGPHIARHDPRAVLAQCDAHEAVLDLHRQVIDGGSDPAWPAPGHCAECFDGDDYKPFPCPTLRADALAFQYRPRLPRGGVATVSAAHRCDEDCTCPDHGTQLWWSRSQNVHACQDATCRFAHGLERHPDYSLHLDFREEWRP